MARPGRKLPNFTLLILGESGKARKVRVTGKMLGGLLAAAAILLVLGVGLFVDYVGDKRELREATAALAQGTGEPRAPESEIDWSDIDPADADLALKLDKRLIELAPVERFFAPDFIDTLALPAAWPVRGWVTSEFGPRLDSLTGRREFHPGIDIAAPISTSIYAPADGFVLFVGEMPIYGHYLILRHGHGLTTHYGHLSRVLVLDGQTVREGEQIARVGNTGQSTGAHLHYEVRLHDVPVDPRRYLPAAPVVVASEETTGEALPPEAAPAVTPTPEPASPTPPLIEVPTPEPQQEPAPDFAN
ncbi:MAG TPA: peptidoglycan DD-metalloendopeptidase family protein [bacterium]|nr:peptidoglycan DD-metalloendopeptidase family protein [bacterium]